ncbi:MAG: hypothetical protein ACLS3C_03420 [Oscillospiraceae bacterium]
MKIYQESSNNLFESFSQISKTFTLFVQRNWTVLGQWDGLLKNAQAATRMLKTSGRMCRAARGRGITATSICSTRARSI